MRQTTIKLGSNSSAAIEEGGLIITVRHLYAGRCDLVVGYPGSLNTEHEMRTGDAVLYQTPTGDTYEVRALGLGSSYGDFLVTKLGQAPKLAAAFSNDDPLNSPFSEEELRKIESSIAAVKAQIRSNGKFQSSQLELIGRKLDEIQSASRRLGRKDWVQFFAGAITSVCASAAFAPDVTQDLFHAIGETFSWAFRSAPTILLLG